MVESSDSEAFSRDTSLCLDGRVTREGMYPKEQGGYSDVYEGFFGTRKVAIKMIRPFRLRQEKLHRRLWREYLAWSNLTHPNILSCLGYTYDLTSGSHSTLPCLISPWMENGTIMSYLQDSPDADRLSLLAGIADGVTYLHTRNPTIVHGDIRGRNILISNQGVPCLTDFGLSRVLDDVNTVSTSSDIAGSLRWMSPELFNKGSKISVQSDVWAYGMTMLEILSGERPYHEERSDAVVFGLLVNGKATPSRPQESSTSEVINDRMWEICKHCWSLEPTARPSMNEVASIIISGYSAPMNDSQEISVVEDTPAMNDITLCDSPVEHAAALEGFQEDNHQMVSNASPETRTVTIYSHFRLRTIRVTSRKRN